MNLNLGLRTLALLAFVACATVVLVQADFATSGQHAMLVVAGN